MLRPVLRFALKTSSKLDLYICDRVRATILGNCEHELSSTDPSCCHLLLHLESQSSVTWNNWVSAACHSPPSHESERMNTLLMFVGSFNPKSSIIVRLSHLTEFGSWSSRAPLGSSRPQRASLCFHQKHRVWTICFFHRTKQPNYWPELAASVSSRWNRLNIRL